MKKFSKTVNIVRKASEEQIQRWSKELIQLLQDEIQNESIYVEEYVEYLKSLNPNIDKLKLAKKIIARRSLKAGGLGTIMNIGGVLTLPITLPTDLYLTFRIQTRMVLSIAYIYGWNIKEKEISTDVLLVMGGSGAIDAVRSAGIKIGKEYAKKAVNKFINREIMKKINKVISRKIITKAGEKSLTSFTKLIPVVAAPIGGGFNYFGTKTIGKTALMFYSG